MENRRPAAVLFDRDGTLIANVPYNGDPEKVVPMPGAAEALSRLRREGVFVAVVTNQSGVAKGLISPDQMHQVNARVEELLGPFDAWAICVHDDADGCSCRKPKPGLIIRAAATMDVSPLDCALIGDIGSDMEAARAAGTRGILVPTAETLPEEIAAAPEVAKDLTTAVDRILAADPMDELNRLVSGGALSRAQIAHWSRW
ncbi:D-glycero-alpha-D-manno-heptose-1,7-bisphosphate 7-phosphatase [Thermoactinospora rubra]|uniref:D-glycero-alpha-D-manno-heptose-1,7-bisphosphate 7-phosphatase n=1 Tax=Thermoactinospora rubra TaxID=1088767 RepID=UPI000A1128E8|nr:HAD family hydrolase [Thermoactinospora rubra]